MNFKKLFLCAAFATLAVPLGGCGNAKVASVPVSHFDGKSFAQQLSLQYAELAFRKLEEGNTPAARIFYEKANRAANGDAVLPELPDGAETTTVFDRVRAGLGETGRAVAVRARAQVMFDCWLEERAQAVDPGDIKACRQSLERALNLLEAAGGTVGRGAG